VDLVGFLFSSYHNDAQSSKHQINYLFDYADGPVCCLIVLYCLLAGYRVFCAVDLDHLAVSSDPV